MKKLTVASIFSNNMVLQREKNINVWGTASEGDVVTVTFGDYKVRDIVKANKWNILLPSMPAGGPYSIIVSDGKTDILFENVMIGEVWLAGGQSNMEWELKNSKDGKEVVSNISNDRVRFYNTPRLSYIDEEYYEKAAANTWEECTPETAATWSAVGYYYAKKIAEELDVTVGILGCNWGGTSASAWMSKESLEVDKDTNSYLEEYEKANEGRSYSEYLEEVKEYNDWKEEWQKEADKCYAINPHMAWEEVTEIVGPYRWPEPLGPKSPFRATGLYETMLKRVMPYTLRGFIYYQGESDDHKPTIYKKLLTKLIENWRTDWEDDELPFLLVQLTMFRDKNVEDNKNWAILREQQMLTHKTLKNTGIAVITDCGEFNNIHPLDKETVGNRLALQGLYHVYGKDIKAYGPIFEKATYLENEIELTFEHTEDGIVVKGDKVEGFEIAGENKEFVKGDTTIKGNKIMVSADGVVEPKYVRYAWTNYGPVTLFNKIGIPLAPFRTSRQDEVGVK